MEGAKSPSPSLSLRFLDSGRDLSLRRVHCIGIQFANGSSISSAISSLGHINGYLLAFDGSRFIVWTGLEGKGRM
jgi:hypothetical protein